MKQRSYLYIGIGTVSLTGVSWFFIHQRRKKKLATELLEKLTLLIDPKTSGILAEKAFNPNYYKQIASQRRIQMIRDEVAKQKAREIKNVWGFLYTSDRDVQQLIDMLKVLQDKAVISKLAAAYLDNEKVSLINDIQNNLNKEQIVRILSAVSTLPNYTTR